MYKIDPIPEAYLSKDADQALAHFMEEMAEALTAAAKLARFGPESVNPELPPSEQETNLVWLRREMVDCVRAYHALSVFFEDLGLVDAVEMQRELDL